MHKHTQPQTIDAMITSLAQYVDACEKNTYIVCNDINLSISYDGGREYFDKLYRKIQTIASPHRYHFNNSNRQNHFDYGDEYETNALFVSPEREIVRYQPFMSCASAQMIIKKEE